MRSDVIHKLLPPLLRQTMTPCCPIRQATANPARYFTHAFALQALGTLRSATMGTTELTIGAAETLLLAAAARLSCAISRNFFLRSVLNEVV